MRNNDEEKYLNYMNSFESLNAKGMVGWRWYFTEKLSPTRMQGIWHPLRINCISNGRKSGYVESDNMKCACSLQNQLLLALRWLTSKCSDQLMSSSESCSLRNPFQNVIWSQISIPRMVMMKQQILVIHLEQMKNMSLID